MTALLDLKTKIDISAYGLSLEELRTAYYQILNGHAELFFVESGFSYYPGDVITAIYPKYNLTDKQQIRKTQDKLNAEADKAVSLVSSDMEDHEKALVVHDWLARHCAYDHADYMNGTIPADCYTALGALINKSAVCSGYAKAYSYIMQEKLGIPCGIVSSDTMDHAWNMIRIGGHYYHVDVTWDDPVWDCIGRAAHRYFLLSDQTIQQKPTPHRGWQASVRADDTRYENGLWTKTDSGIIYYDGIWYFVDNTAMRLKKTTDILNGTTTDCYTFDKWETADQMYYKVSFSYIWDYKGRLIFNSAKKIHSMSFATGKVSPVYEPEGLSAGTNIYGFKLGDGSLKYAVQTKPGLDSSQDRYIRSAPLPRFEACATHSWDKGTVTTPATCAGTGIKTFVCMFCDAEQTETIPANGHQNTEIRGKKSATYTTEGYTGDTYCKDCGQKIRSGTKIAVLTAPKKGTILRAGGFSYRVTKAGPKNGTVEFCKWTGNAQTLTLPSSVTIGQITYKVTSVGEKVLKNNKKVTQVTLGSNIITVGKEAFSGCKNLRKITIRSTDLNSVGGSAIKNIHKRTVIKCPARKVKKYKTLFSAKTGFEKKTMKITG